MQAEPLALMPNDCGGREMFRPSMRPGVPGIVKLPDGRNGGSLFFLSSLFSTEPMVAGEGGEGESGPSTDTSAMSLVVADEEALAAALPLLPDSRSDVW